MWLKNQRRLLINLDHAGGPLWRQGSRRVKDWPTLREAVLWSCGAVLAALVRPVLTFVSVTVPRWWMRWRTPPPPQVMTASWLARQEAEDGKRGEHP